MSATGTDIYRRATRRVISLRHLYNSPRTRLEDGTIGYRVRVPRTDDCFAAALATVLQVPIGEVPDPRIDERLAAGESPEEITSSAWDGLYEWLDRRGLRMIVHEKVPANRRRWIGIVPWRGDFNDHCLVMRMDRLLFDPAYLGGNYVPPGKIAFGLSFQTTTREGSSTCREG